MKVTETGSTTSYEIWFRTKSEADQFIYRLTAPDRPKAYGITLTKGGHGYTVRYIHLTGQSPNNGSHP